MIIFYRVLINLVFILSPIILIFRLLKKKEHVSRFKEKFCFFTKKRVRGKLLWFHGASVGELQSIIPLIEKIEKNKNIKKILITTNTLSSAKIIDKLNLKKTIHQFFPIDTNYHSNKFLNYWKPTAAFFIDSEIWPNTFINLEKSQIPIILLNGRITKKTFDRWYSFRNFSNFIFNKINFCLSSSKVSSFYLRKLGVKKIKYFGNLKFSQSENEKLIKFKYLKKIINDKKVWCASSTHHNEEYLCGLTHIELKKKFKNIFTIIIPRHVERSQSIKKELLKLNLNVHTHETQGKPNKNTEIYIVDSYGKTKSIYRYCKNIFLGGSLIKHGGQNPLEATRYGCKVLHGPHVENFKEIYDYLGKLELSSKVNHHLQLSVKLKRLLLKKNNSKKIQNRLNKIGDKILNDTYNEIYQFIKNEN